MWNGYRLFTLLHGLLFSVLSYKMTTTNDYISLLRKYLSTKADAYGITKIGIFGSVARNEQTEDSDVDVCVEMKKPDLFTMVHIKEELQELFGKPVDIVRLRKNMNSMLLKQIERDGIYEAVSKLKK